MTKLDHPTTTIADEGPILDSRVAGGFVQVFLGVKIDIIG